MAPPLLYLVSISITSKKQANLTICPSQVKQWASLINLLLTNVSGTRLHYRLLRVLVCVESWTAVITQKSSDMPKEEPCVWRAFRFAKDVLSIFLSLDEQDSWWDHTIRTFWENLEICLPCRCLAHICLLPFPRCTLYGTTQVCAVVISTFIACQRIGCTSMHSPSVNSKFRTCSSN
jgi:hypothetical protein